MYNPNARWIPQARLTVGIINDYTYSPLSSVSSTVYRENADFRRFAERMKSTGKIYVLLQSDDTVRTLSCDVDEVDGSPDGAEKWLDCCLRDYLKRKQQFEKRCGSRKQAVQRILCLTLVFCLALYAVWPLWDFLIDMDAEALFKTLSIAPTSDLTEVKRAYREQVRKWHPDRNLGCGEPCRVQMRKIQHAYDVLLSRGGHTNDMANRYRSQLLQIRSLIFFRVYNMAASASQEMFNIIMTVCGAALSDSLYSGLRIGSGVGTILFFTAYETFYVGGFNAMMIIQVFFLVVTMISSAGRENYVTKARKTAYVDLLWEATVMIGPCAIVGVAHAFLFSTGSDSVEELFRTLFGVFYVAAYLYRTMPNLLDNMKKRSCTVSMNYFTSIMEPTVTFYGVSSAEIGFIVDDLFAFTCRVPSVFRVVVFVSHFIYLCQFSMLPWEGPLRTKKPTGNRGTDNEGSGQHQVHSRDARSGEADEKPDVPKTLPKRDLTVFGLLDEEFVDWSVATSACYHKEKIAAYISYTQKYGRAVVSVDVVACEDFQNVGVVVTMTEPKGSAELNPASSKANAKHEIVMLGKDEGGCRALAFCCGPMRMIPRPNSTRDPAAVREQYRLAFPGIADLTPSKLWRRRIRSASHIAGPGDGKNSLLDVSTILCIMLFLGLLLMANPAVVPSAKTTALRTVSLIPVSMQPFSYLRFRKLFGAEHPVNALAAGTVTGFHGLFTLCTVDVWDAFRQFQLYVRE